MGCPGYLLMQFIEKCSEKVPKTQNERRFSIRMKAADPDGSRRAAAKGKAVGKGEKGKGKGKGKSSQGKGKGKGGFPKGEGKGKSHGKGFGSGQRPGGDRPGERERNSSAV